MVSNDADAGDGPRSQSLAAHRFGCWSKRTPFASLRRSQSLHPLKRKTFGVCERSRPRCQCARQWRDWLEAQHSLASPTLCDSVVDAELLFASLRRTQKPSPLTTTHSTSRWNTQVRMGRCPPPRRSHQCTRSVECAESSQSTHRALHLSHVFSQTIRF